MLRRPIGTLMSDFGNNFYPVETFSGWFFDLIYNGIRNRQKKHKKTGNILFHCYDSVRNNQIGLKRLPN